MAYSYDQHRPVWIDSARMDLDDQSDALRVMAETVPATLDDHPDHPWLGSVAAASQAPRIPRHRPVTGTSRQGRVIHRAGDAQRHTEPLVSRLEAIEDAGHGMVLMLCLAVLLVMVPALVIGVNWADVISLLAMIGGAR